MFRSLRPFPIAVAALALTAAACGSSAAKAAAPATTEKMQHPSTTVMHDSGGMAHLAGSMSADYIKAADQTSHGTSLVVEDVGLAGHSGFVVAVADTGGTMGDELGVSALVKPGASMGVTVSLMHPLNTMTKVFLVLHIDNGDGKFSAADAPAMVGAKVVELPVEVTVK